MVDTDGLPHGGRRLEGGIPAEIGRLQKLQAFGVQSNRLTGPIPPELGGLTQLQVLSGGFNRLTGNIPPELGRTNLTKIFLPNNRYCSSLPPPSIFTLQSLSFLHPQQHLPTAVSRLTGGIPVELGSLSENLNILILSNNRLEGSIPPELGNCSALKQLKLTSNHLTGAIPSTLGHLNQLKILDLSSNR
eukprot:SM000643S20144  [mRNA]  locus=s643:303:2047:- [translate_table: standard]